MGRKQIVVREYNGSEIAVIGMAGRFPGARNLDEYWQNLCNGLESISRFSLEELVGEGNDAERVRTSGYVPAKGILEGLDGFDAKFFDFAPKEARFLDPQFRLLHECVWEGLEDAGYSPGTHRKPVALIAGAGFNEWWLFRAFASNMTTDSESLEMATLTLRDYLCTLVSYKLGLTGPSTTIQTACSTSLVAIHQAVQSLLTGECGIAVAGGVSIHLPSKSGYLHQEGMIHSPDGRCRPFDAAAAGTVFSDGAAVVVLKRLEEAIADRDHVYAVIRGSAINNDGRRKVGYAAPSTQGQAQAIRSALNVAGVPAESITYVEAHGTGTALGDPIEVEALTKAFRTEERGFCGIGSVKSNVGHLNAAAGVAGFIKTALALDNKKIPPTLHFEEPNPKIDFSSSPFRVVDKLTDWTTDRLPRRAGVSSFGLGGTNAHVILEEAPDLPPPAGPGLPHHLLLLSAKTPTALRAACERLRAFLQSHPDVSLADVAYTLQVGRAQFAHRIALTCATVAQAIEALGAAPASREAPERAPPLMWSFADEESSAPAAAQQLCDVVPSFRAAFERCVGSSPTDKACPGLALFALEYGLADAFEQWGLEAHGVWGAGIGEYVAACRAGVLSIDAARTLLVARARAIREGTTSARDAFASEVRSVSLSLPSRRYVSSLTGQWAGHEVTTPAYWERQLRDPASPRPAVERLFEHDGALSSEIGPGLTTWERVLDQLGQLWVAGARVQWSALPQAAVGRRIALPTYPFERERYWLDGPSVRFVLVDPKEDGAVDAAAPQRPRARPSAGEPLPQLIKAAWSKVLGTDPQPEDNFFESGGDSLKATSLVSQIATECGVPIQVRDIFKFPTLHGLSETLRTRQAGERREIARVEAKPHYAVSSSQKRMYVIQRNLGSQTTYNYPMALRARGPIDRAKVEAALGRLIDRHEILRTVFTFVGDEPLQAVLPSIPFALEVFETDEAGAPECARRFVRPFHLARGPLIRAAIARVADAEHIILLDLHNIVADGASMNVFIREFCALYGEAELPALPIQYKDFAEWQKSSLSEPWMRRQEEYWLGKFSDIPELRMPLDSPRGSVQRFGGKTISFELPASASEAVRRLAKEHAVTLNSVFYTLYLALLHKYTDQTDIVLGSLVAGRRHPQTEGLIGLFTNFLPVRVAFDRAAAFSSLLRTTHDALLEAYDHQDYPIDALVERLSGRIPRDRNPLFDTMLVFHNEHDRSIRLEVEGLTFEQYPLSKDSSKLDIKVDVVEKPDGLFKCVVQYNDELYADDSIARLATHFRALVDEVGADPSRPLTALGTLSASEAEQMREKRARAAQKVAPAARRRVSVSATFSLEPLQPYMDFWTRSFALPLDIRVAPYNQVFQELLRERGPASAADELQVILVRFEDWLREDRSDERLQHASLERSFGELLAIVREKAGTGAYVIGVLPPGGGKDLAASVRAYIDALTLRWIDALSSLDHVHVVDLRGAAASFAVAETFDPAMDIAAHVPFTEAFYAAMGTALTRSLVAHLRGPFKVLVLDCDNTLWRGVVGEDGPAGIELDAPRAALQRFARKKRDEGFLLALASKNNEEDVWAAFEAWQMPLSREDFAATRINWRPKSQNLRELAEELNVGLDSFVMIDDSVVECVELVANAPDALVLQLPERTDEIPAFLEHVWALDKLRVTAEDRQRGAMYRTEQARKAARSSATETDFVRGLELKMSFRPLTGDGVRRAAQLTQRTNQFNLRTIRRTEEQVRTLMARREMHCWTIEAADRFGSYGMSGLLFAERKDASLVLDTFLLSCRVLGRGIEDAVLDVLGRHCAAKGFATVDAEYVPNGRNEMVADFLARAGWTHREQAAHVRVFTVGAATLAKRSHWVEVFDGAPLPEPDASAAPPRDRSAGEGVPAPTTAVAPAAHAELSWPMRQLRAANSRHAAYYAPLATPTAAAIVAEVTTEARRRAPERGISLAGPTTQLEECLCAHWASVLNLPRVGVDDNFFALGGNSLSAIKLETRLEEGGLAVDGATIFMNPTVRQYASLLRPPQEKTEASAPPEPDALGVAAAAQRGMASAESARVVIPNVEPFNEFIYKDCFYSAAFPLVRHLGRSLVPLLTNDTVLYSYDSSAGCAIGAVYEPAEHVENVLSNQGILQIRGKRATDVCDLIVSSVRQGHPIVVRVDCYYESIRPDTYHKRHHPHALLVYGFDVSQQTFRILEHQHVESPLYAPWDLPFADMREAYAGFIDRFSAEQPETYYEFHADPAFRAQTTADWQAQFRRNTQRHLEKISHGLEALRAFQRDADAVLLEPQLLAQCSDELVAGLNDVIAAKKVESYKLAGLGLPREVAAPLEKIVAGWTTIRAVIAKYTFSKKYQPKSIETVRALLGEVLGAENSYARILSTIR